MTGRVIAGRYNLQHPIGRGAMGVVWRARDQILDRDVAVKEVVLSSLIGEEERRNAYQRTLREARTAARLSHRGLVAVYDVAEEDGRPWIVMELVPSRSLDQVLTVEGRLPPLRVARIGQQLLSALAAAHIAGVLHRDVKPSNVLIATERTGTGWDERAVLTDFGIAQFEGDPRLTQTGMVMGSPGFTAPERIRGGDATPGSDLWSLGATLYAAVEGRGPYEQRGGAITTMSAIINEDAPVAASAGLLAPVIAALLRRDPSARPAAPAAARMFAQVIPLLSAGEQAPLAAAHPPTVLSSRVPPAGPPASKAPAPESTSEPAAAAAPTPAIAPTTPEDPAPAIARLSADRAAEAEAPSPAAPAEPASADAPAPGSEAKPPEAKPVEPVGEPEAADAEAAETAAPTPTPGTEADAAAEAGPDPAEGSDTDAAAAEATSAVEAVEAVEAVSAVEASQTPDGTDDAGDPEEVGAEQSSAGDTVADRRPAGYRPRELPIPPPPPPPQPKPSPTFTAAKLAERGAAPTFSAARPDQPGTPPRHGAAQPSVPQYGTARPGAAPQGGQWPAAAQFDGATPPYGPHPGTAAATPGSGGQYAGPSQPYPDLAVQYPPAPSGGQAQRRRGSGWWIVLVICAVVVAAAIGAGTALALRHHNASGTGTRTSAVVDVNTPFKSVNALNDPSADVPTGWTTETVAPSTYHTTAGFTVDVPPGWIKQSKGLATYFYGPDDTVLDIDLTPHVYPGNMVREAENIERQALAGHTFPGYRRLNLRKVPVRGTNGAFWQFTWIFNGVGVRTDDILFVMPTPAGKQSYAVYIRAPKNGWNRTYLPIFEKILPTFQSVPPPS
jgi:eukaryotic-like serine/threonine-protein kinase